jgi:protein dithiol:quinone oxidoreductase
MKVSQRSVVISGFLACAGLMAAALYFQHVMKLEPCPLCILQRVVVTILGLVFLVMAVHNPQHWGRRVYGVVTVLLSALGLAVAGRHVWLQHLPADQVPTCGPGLDYMLDNFPMGKTLEMVFRGSGECAEVGWTFLAFSIPEWLLVVFVGFALMGLYFVFTRASPQAAVAEDGTAPQLPAE